MSDEYPVHDKLDVIEGEDVFRNENWWKAVVVCDSWNGHEVNVYLWQNQNGSWRRKQKFKIDDKQEWLSTESIIDDMVDEHIE